jgi:hypothetical protein
LLKEIDTDSDMISWALCHVCKQNRVGYNYISNSGTDRLDEPNVEGWVTLKQILSKKLVNWESKSPFYRSFVRVNEDGIESYRCLASENVPSIW